MSVTLQKYNGINTRYRCPNCNRQRSFTRYVDTATGEHIAPHVGLCNRQDKCGYHFTPRAYSVKDHKPWTIDHSKKKEGSKKSIVYGPSAIYCKVPSLSNRIHGSHVDRSLTAYRDNNFVLYLYNRFGEDVATTLVNKYRIGTSKHWPGATVFWQIDHEGYARAGKIMLYDKATGKRIKQPFNHITWVHTVLSKKAGSEGDGKTESIYPPKDFQLQQCFFGEHLLTDAPGTPVAICESEKTAIIASTNLPAFTWLACGSLQGLNPAKCKVLKGRQVMLFPDVSGYNLWRLKALQLQTAMPGTTFMVSEVLERIATETDRANGIDLADVLA